jgi:prepilin-type N-terminal cleavage/methylation domain-containing protein
VVVDGRGCLTPDPDSRFRCAGSRWSIASGFTLTELLIVIALLLIMTIAVIPVVVPALDERKIKDATRGIQAALAAARDRAVSSGQIRGIRLIRDETDPWEVSRIVYVGTPEPYAVGTVQTTGYRVEAERKYTASAVDPQWGLVTPGSDGALGTTDDLPRVDAPLTNPLGNDVRTLQAYIRFNSTGRIFHIIGVDNSVSPHELVLDSSEPPPPVLGFGTTYQISNPAQPLPDTPPLPLPDGIVIDVRASPIATGHPYALDAQIDVPRSRYIPNQVPTAAVLRGPDGTLGTSDDLKPVQWPPMDILFASNGLVVGPGAQQGLIHFWLGERGDKGGGAGADGNLGTADDVEPTKRTKLVTFNTRTGAVQVWDSPRGAGTAVQGYPEIYGPPEQAFGTFEPK